MQQKQAIEALPTDAQWSCSFGYPGEGGYVEYHRTPSGERWQLTNGPHDAMAPFDWRCAKLA
jgi:hypothetical protein